MKTREYEGTWTMEIDDRDDINEILEEMEDRWGIVFKIDASLGQRHRRKTSRRINRRLIE